MKASDQEHAKWAALMAEGLKAFKSFGHEEAAKHYEDAVRLAEAFGLQDKRLGIALYCLRWTLFVLRLVRPDATEPPRALPIALPVLEETLPADVPELISFLKILVVHCMHDKPAQVEARKRLLEILERIHGPEHPEVLHVAYDLGFDMVALKKYSEAEKLCMRCLEAAEKNLGATNPRTIDKLEWLGRLYFKQNKDQQAELIFLRAFQSRIQSSVPWDKQMGATPDVDDLSNVALKFLDQFEPQDLRLARGLIFVGSRTWHKPHLRDPLVLRGLSLLDGQFSSGDPESLECLRILDRIDRFQLFDAEVQTTLLTFLTRRNLPLEAVLNLIESLGFALRSKHRHADSEHFHRDWLDRTEKAWGFDDPRVAKVASALAESYFLQKSYSQAKDLYQRLLTAAEKLHGPKSKDAAPHLCFLGLIARDQHRYADAEAYLKRAIEIDKMDERALSNLADVLRKSGRPKEAAPFQVRADEIAERRADER